MCLWQEVPVVIVRNKVDTLVAEGGLGKRSGADLRRQVQNIISDLESIFCDPSSDECALDRGGVSPPSTTTAVFFFGKLAFLCLLEIYKCFFLGNCRKNWAKLAVSLLVRLSIKSLAWEPL